jgi:Flp pilus assembly pilin Flp
VHKIIESLALPGIVIICACHRDFSAVNSLGTNLSGKFTSINTSIGGS